MVRVPLSTIALDQSESEKLLSHCKKLMATNHCITLAKGSCNKTVISLGSVGSAGSSVPRSTVPQISPTRNIGKSIGRGCHLEYSIHSKGLARSC